MKSLSYLILLFLIFNFVSCQKNKTKTEKAVISDTIKINTPALNDSILLAKYNLNNYPKASFKIFYGQSYGFDSEEHRYGYVIMIIDSVVYLRYHSPKNESWNEVKYEESYPLSSKQFQQVYSTLTKCKLRNKKPKVGISGETASATYHLIVNTEKVKMDGLVEWGTIQGEASMSQDEINKGIRKDKIESSSIGGNYELFIKELEKLFPKLNYLKHKMKR